MATLDERFQASHRVRARLGRVDANGISQPVYPHREIAPDLERIIGEACFGLIWDRPALSLEQRSMATISVLTALGKERQLKGHVEGGLNIGLSAEQVVEVLVHLFFYLGAPAVNTALIIAKQVFDERGIQVEPDRVYDTNEDPDEMYRRGVAKRRELLEDPVTETSGEVGEVDQQRERYSREYLWGSIWTRPGLDTPSRCICTLSALTVLGRERMLRNYVGAALRVGLSEAQVLELFFHLSFYTGFPAAWSAVAVAKEVFRSR